MHCNVRISVATFLLSLSSIAMSKTDQERSGHRSPHVFDHTLRRRERSSNTGTDGPVAAHTIAVPRKTRDSGGSTPGARRTSRRLPKHKRYISDDYNLYRYLMHNYRPVVRPVLDADAAIVVGVYTYVYQIIEVVSAYASEDAMDYWHLHKGEEGDRNSINAIAYEDQPTNTILLSACFELFWQDDFLQWDPADFGGITETFFPSQIIWTPEISAYYSVASNRMLEKYTYLRVNHTGGVRYFTPFAVKNLCHVDVKYFPFDKQKCVLYFGPWAYRITELDWNLLRDTADTADFYDNQEWLLEKTKMERMVLKYDYLGQQLNYSCFTLELHIFRQSFYYIFNLVLPTAIISLVSVIGFHMPGSSSQSRDAKFRLGIMTILSMTMLLLAVVDDMPKFAMSKQEGRRGSSSSVPLIGIYYFTLLAIIALGTVTSSLFVAMERRVKHKAVPWWLKWLAWEWKGCYQKDRMYQTGIRCNKTKDAYGSKAEEIAGAPPVPNGMLVNLIHDDSVSNLQRRTTVVLSRRDQLAKQLSGLPNCNSNAYNDGMYSKSNHNFNYGSNFRCDYNLINAASHNKVYHKHNNSNSNNNINNDAKLSNSRSWTPQNQPRHRSTSPARNANNNVVINETPAADSGADHSHSTKSNTCAQLASSESSATALTTSKGSKATPQGDDSCTVRRTEHSVDRTSFPDLAYPTTVRGSASPVKLLPPQAGATPQTEPSLVSPEVIDISCSLSAAAGGATPLSDIKLIDASIELPPPGTQRYISERQVSPTKGAQLIRVQQQHVPGTSLRKRAKLITTSSRLSYKKVSPYPLGDETSNKNDNIKHNNNNNSNNSNVAANKESDDNNVLHNDNSGNDDSSCDSDHAHCSEVPRADYGLRAVTQRLLKPLSRNKTANPYSKGDNFANKAPLYHISPSRGHIYPASPARSSLTADQRISAPKNRRNSNKETTGLLESLEFRLLNNPPPHHAEIASELFQFQNPYVRNDPQTDIGTLGPVDGFAQRQEALDGTEPNLGALPRRDSLKDQQGLIFQRFFQDLLLCLLSVEKAVLHIRKDVQRHATPKVTIERGWITIMNRLEWISLTIYLSAVLTAILMFFYHDWY